MDDPGIWYQFYDLLHSDNHHLHSQPQIKLCWQQIFASLISCSLKFLSLPACPSTFPHMLWVCSFIFTIHLHFPSLPTSPLWVPLDSSPSLYQLAISTSRIQHPKFFLLSFPYWSPTIPTYQPLTLLNPKYVSVSPQLLRISRKKSLHQYNIQYQVWGLFRSQSETWFCYLLPGKVWASDITSLNICFLICKMGCIHYNAFSLKENQPTYVASRNKVVKICSTVNQLYSNKNYFLKFYHYFLII